MNRSFVHILCSFSLALQLSPACFAASQPELNFKIYSPQDSAPVTPEEQPASSAKNAGGSNGDAGSSQASTDKSPVDSLWNSDPAAQTEKSSPTPAAATEPAVSAPNASTTADTAPVSPATAETGSTDTESSSTAEASKSDEAKTVASKKTLLQGYIRVVPSGTKIPIIMDTAVDTDTSQEGDEFAARTSEDLLIDGATVVPAGSVIKGRIAQLNSPKNLGRSGSVALKFDTVTTPDNRQIPLVANLVARGGVVHARRGVKDIAMDTGTLVLPAAIGIGIGALAGGASNNNTTNRNSSSHLGRGGGAMIGAGIGLGVGVIILAVKKGKKVDVRPGDELKIELAEDLRMPM
jgi:hypothetical protein